MRNFLRVAMRNKRHAAVCCLLGLFGISTQPAVAQSFDALQFWESPVNDALTQKVTKQIAQDGSGAMWFVTLEGLSRYNGHSVMNFPTATALGGGSIKGIDIDPDGQLWVVTNQRLLYFDQTTKTFSAVKNLPVGIELFSVAADREGNIWLGERGNVGAYDPQTHWYQRFEGKEPLPSDAPVVDILFDGSDRLFALLEGHGLFELLEQTTPKKLVSTEDAGGAELWMVEQVGSALWIATQGAGVITVDLETGKLGRIVEGKDKGLPSDVVYHIVADSHGVWVSTAGGLALVNSNLATVRIYDNTNSALPENWLLYSYTGMDGSLWVATNHGLFQGKMPLIQDLNDSGHKLDSADINAIHVTSTGEYWIGTDTGLHHRPSGATHFSTINSQTHPVLKDDIIMSLAHQKDMLWVGTFDGGLYRYWPEQDSMSAIPVDPESPHALHASGITALLVHSSGELIAATYGGGISIINAAGDVIRSIDLPGRSGGTENAFTLLEDHDRSVLIGTAAGLARLSDDLQTVSWIQFDEQPQQDNLPGTTIAEIKFPVWELTHGQEGDLWLGTYDHGLLRWHRDADGKTQGLKDLSDVIELPSRTTLGIHFSTSDTLWVSHNHGLTRVNTENLASEHFGSGFGDKSINFNMGASYKADDGTIYFGSDRGVKVLTPYADRFEKPAIKIGIDAVTVMGEPIAIPSNQHIIKLPLGYNDTLTSIEFFSTDFTEPRNNAYAYRLRGLDDQWMQLGNGHTINLNRLPAGQYQLEIAVKDSAGNWHYDARSIELTVEPPWWGSILAYAVYSLCLTLLVRFYFWVRRNHELAQRYQALEIALHPGGEPEPQLIIPEHPVTKTLPAPNLAQLNHLKTREENP
ncbi:MAG: triple tyrosine motif-containing protein [Halieaceae bacterium]|nr:triple tyrosine motif-containing protein [Halieaceae bacterium]